MRISIASPGTELGREEVEQIEKDLEKLDRRIANDDATARVRVTDGQGAKGYHVVLEVDHRRFHFIAKADHSDPGVALRQAREDVLRQINDHSPGGHSQFAKGT